MFTCEPMPAIDEDGWCEAIHPMPGYLAQCCDCNLIHEMDFQIVRRTKDLGDGHFDWEPVEDPAIIVLMRMRRA